MTDQLQQAVEIENINDAVDFLATEQPAAEEEAAPIVEEQGETTVEGVEAALLAEDEPIEEAKELSLEEQVSSMSDDDLNSLADKLVEQGGEVPSFVVKKLRKQKTEAKEELSEKGGKLDDTLNNMTTILEKMSQNQQPATEAPVESNGLNSEEFAEAMSYEPEKAAKMMQDQMKTMQDKMKAMEEQSAISQLQVAHGNIEQQARKRDVDYDAKKIKFIELEAQNLKVSNPMATESQLKAHAENTFNTRSMEYLLQGQDPTIVLDGYFKSTGIEFRQSKANKKDVDIDAIASSINKHQTLGGKSAKPSQGIEEMTLSKLADMHPNKVQAFGKKYANHINGKKDGKKVTATEALDIFMREQAKKESSTL